MRENDKTVVSIFVNPTQFNDPKDLKAYPTQLETDLELLKALEVDLVFSPEEKDVYPDSYRFKLSENQDSKLLCGADREGHFDGVLTVVMKLFHIVNPTHAYFGEKDYQQLSLISDMAKAFFMDVKVVGCPTFRSREGLALSSRNERLSTQARAKAPNFAKILQSAPSIDEARAELDAQGFEVVYLDQLWNRRFGAVKLEDVRLIDNVAL